ncbi:hypothetical protein SGLAM104S_00779 [Streptomyces glaucescens]
MPSSHGMYPMVISLPRPTFAAEASAVPAEDPNTPMPPATSASTATPTTGTTGRGRCAQTAFAPLATRAFAAARRPSGEICVPRALVIRSR